MYGIDSSVQSESGFKSIEVGISENNLLDKVTFGPSSTEKQGSPEALQFHFKNTSGASFRHLEFPIDEEREKLNGDKYYDRLVKEGKTPDLVKPLFIIEYVKRVYKDQASRIKHIMSKFVSEDKTLISGVNTFQGFSNAVIEALGDSYKGKLLRLKLIYNNKDYAIFPKYADFVEVQTDKPTRLRVGKKDRIEKQAPDAVQEITDY